MMPYTGDMKVKELCCKGFPLTDPDNAAGRGLFSGDFSFPLLVLKEAALDELEHKLSLEKALLEGQMEGAGSMERQIPTMNLGYVLAKKELSPESDAREALAYAIHLEKGAIDFYQRMAQGCAGAPMAKLFDRLLADETKHLQQLEDMYEQHFMTEN